MKNLSKENKARLYLFLTAFLWSLGGLLIKGVTWHPLAIAGVRSALAVPVFLLFCRPRPRFTWSFLQIATAVAYMLSSTLFVVANKLTTAANVIFLQYTAPVYVAIFGAWFLKERTTAFDWLTIFAAMGGMFLFFLDDLEIGGMLGNILALVMGVIFAALALLLRKQKDGAPLEGLLLGNILTALVGLPFIFGSPPGVSGWLILLLLGIFQLALPYVLYAKAVKHVTALEAILISVLEAVLNPLWVFLVIGETPGPWSLLGGAIVLVAVTVRSVVRATGGRAEVIAVNSGLEEKEIKTL